MVAPIYIPVVALGVSFLLPLFDRFGKKTVNGLFLLTLTFFAAAALRWLSYFSVANSPVIHVFTAGFAPPLSINLQVGLEEALLLAAVNVLALAGAVYLLDHLNAAGTKARVLFLLFTLGMNGLVMTRDIFNLFVFLEITSIAAYALIGLDLKLHSLAAGFKYMIAGSLASIFLLFGIILLYQASGTLNIDGMIAANLSAGNNPLIQGAIFMLFLSFFIEMKQFPANGWALDVYQAAHPGVAAMISAGSSGAIFFALYKIFPLAGDSWYLTAAISGSATFVASNWMALRQKQATRLLGYSSVGQMGLLLAVLGFSFYYRQPHTAYGYILAALFFNHFFAKAGLYWIAGIIKKDKTASWSVLLQNPLLLFFFGLFVLALIGFPPFAGFWGKWALMMNLGGERAWYAISFLLLGSLLEAVYYLRWLGQAVRGEPEKEPLPATDVPQLTVTGLFALISLAVGIWLGGSLLPKDFWTYAFPVILAAVVFLFDGFSVYLRVSASLVVMTFLGYYLYPTAQGISFYFAFIFILGGMLMLMASLYKKERSAGFYPLLILMFSSLAVLTVADTLLGFFMSWELMTVSSYLLILRGRKSREPALLYVLFSLGGALAMLAGFAVLQAVRPGAEYWAELAHAGDYAVIIYFLISLAFLVKVAALGWHIWAPDAYAEAEDDLTAMLSAILSKAGIWGLLLLAVFMGAPLWHSLSLSTVLGWLGTLTAFFATLYAIFQEDAKRLLAWSSIGQVGYIVMGVAMMSHLGWLAALWHTLNHFLFKGLLFLAIAGVIHRTGTRNMYEMGGLIKRMPFTFFSVLIGIIALSGVPPLTGFGGKWLLYEALIEKGWYLQAGVAFFASTIAFLYCYRLIHAIFLGIPKPDQLQVREAPFRILFPQYILIAFIFVFSLKPAWLLKPLSAMVAPYFTPTLGWQGGTAVSSLGYWNGTVMMILVVFIFALVLLNLLWMSRGSKKVKPFNIVYAAEKPDRPQTTHYAWHFFAPYQRAMRPLLKPLVRHFWQGVGEWTATGGSVLRRIYNGNGQSYAMLILLFAIILFALTAGA